MILSPSRCRLALAAALLALGTLPCHAELGGTVADVATDQARMLASRRLEPAAAFTRHVMTSPGGIEVTEFAAPSGVIFAVSWQGPLQPDLRQLLGASFEQFHSVLRSQADPRRPVSVDQPNLVVRSSGRMRGFSGYAYLPAQMPAGVTEQDLR